jgi:phage-related protein
MADKLYWIDANGTEIPFNSENIKVLKGMQGRNMPPVSFVEERVSFQHGSHLRQANIEARDVDIPLLIKADNEIELRKLVRDITRAFNPLKSDGRLRVLSPDGSQRELNCRYSQGMEGQEDRDNKGSYWQTVVLVFRAFDPFWYDAQTIVETFTTGEPATFFPFLPLRLASSSVFADTTIDNVGDVETYPEWIINGPGENIVLRNLTTGEATSINYSLGLGESITVNTKPFQKTVTKNDGTNLFYTLSDDSSLWALAEGKNSIRIEMSDSTEQSSVQLSYKNRYWGP